MDGTKFDALSRWLAGTSDRRRALRGLAAIALGGGATIVAATDGDAANRICRLAGQKCVRNSQCCSTQCDTARTTPRARRNRCVCGDLAACHGRCVDLKTDDANCGFCGNVCSATDEYCAGGVCTCPDGGSVCDGICVDLQTDDANCGACDNVCAATDEYCANGLCTCPDGGTACSGACVDTDTNEDHCGACDSPCDVGWTCSSGQCMCGGQLSCGADALCCNDTCTPESLDNCGTCGNACPNDGFCVQGKCYGPCQLQGSCNYCAVDGTGSTWHFNAADSLDGYGCANREPSPCPAGHFCGVIFNTKFNPGSIVLEDSGSYGICYSTSVTTCS